MPQPELNLVSAITAGAALIANEIETEDGAIASIYAMGVGPSSSGKNVGFETINEIFGALEPDARTAIGEIKSSTAFEKTLSDNGRRILPLDEAGHSMAAAKNNSFASQVASMATKLWNGSFTPGSRAAGRETYDIPKPRLSMYVTGSPDRIAEALDMDAVKDGGLPRYLFATARKVNPRRDRKKPERAEVVMTDLKAAFHGFIVKGEPTESHEAVPRTYTAEICPDADLLIDEYADSASEYAETMPHNSGEEFLLKGAENVKRVALIHATLRATTPAKARIEIEDVTFAIEVIGYSIRSWLKFVSKIGQSPRAKAIDEVMELIASQPMGVKKSALNNRFYRKLGNDKLMEYINDLLRAGKIEGRTGPRGGAIYVATGAE